MVHAAVSLAGNCGYIEEHEVELSEGDWQREGGAGRSASGVGERVTGSSFCNSPGVHVQLGALSLELFI
jgi:hypothetical protein